VADLDAVLDPSREAILDTRVIVDASENQLVDGASRIFLVNFYPIIRDFPHASVTLSTRYCRGKKALAVSGNGVQASTAATAEVADDRVEVHEEILDAGVDQLVLGGVDDHVECRG